MNKLYLLFMLLFVVTLSNAQEKFQHKELWGNEANKLWQGAEHIWLKQENTIPAFVQFRSGSEPDEASFFSILKKTFRLPSSYNFEQTGLETDQMGWQHKRFQLTVNNVPVSNGIFLLHIANGKVKKYNGYLFRDIYVNTSASLNESSALAFALSDVNATTYKWQLPGEEEFLKQESGDANATFFPKGELEILQVGDNSSTIFKLAWKFDIYAHAPMSRQYMYIDAQSGNVLKRANRIHEANTNGTAVTAYRGARAIVADSYNGTYRLYETTRGLGVRTRNMLTGTSYGSAVEFTDADNYWNNANGNLDQYAGDGHWGAEKTYDFYQTMGRNSINGNGYLLNLYVHYDDGYVNAFWDGTRMTFGDGNGTYDPLTSLDITGHEITHGLTENTANLDYSYESGALNESFSDIFGAAIEWYADSVQADWTIAEDIGPAFRSMSNPNTYGDPDTYLGTNWYTGTGDNGGVHYNSGVQNHWYYRLVQGGSGTNDIGNAFNVTGIGRTKANQIAWRNLVNYLTNSSDYYDSRFYAIQSALDLFGPCSQEVVSTTKAWYAVGVGADYLAGADAQFTASPLTGCTLPFTVTFSNTSSNASSYVWYFGDGTTSTATNPSHTYTVNGLYTVKLVANGGGTCGSDSVTYTNLINVNTINPCVVILPTTGTYQTQTSCTGTIYDSGGPSGNYTGNTSSIVTIAPTGASRVTLHFTQFDMEDTYDFLYVYDGPSTASPVIGSFTGTTIPADITSTGSSITVRQFSDPFVEGAGFTIQWTCILPVVTPVANFIADVTQSCTGAIKFTDLTSGGAIAWLWNFGDGNTSTTQHPTHVYQTNAVFTVSLTATNTFGNNTNTKNNYITITKPAGPTVPAAASCGPFSYTLTTGDVNPATWFDDAGNVVSNTNPFVTPVLSTTTIYHVQDTISQPVYHAGPATNTAVGVTGSNFNNNATLGLKFNVFKKSILQSVLVYATGDGYRTIQYRDSIGGIISQKSVFIPNGTSRVTLNLDLIPGSSYLLRLKDTTNLYRNQQGAVFPYNDAGGIVSITGNNAGTAPTNYYYFYDWEVKEQDCISLRTPVTLTIKPAVTATATFTNVSCFGGTNGSVSVTPAGGTPGFSYQWSNSANTSAISNVTAGLYLVTVTDALGCTTLSGQLVSQPTALVPSASATNVSCNGGNNGAINLSVGGGTPGYGFNWGGGIVLQNRTTLTAGTYLVTITDANSCTASSSATVTEPTALNLAVNSVNTSCNLPNGNIVVNVSGGTSGYTYLWNQGQNSASISDLVAGNYSLTVTDNNSCTSSTSVTINGSLALAANSSAIGTSCFGSSDGSADIAIVNGTQPIAYVWSNGANTSSITNVTAGNYTATATDGAGCSVSASQTVPEPDALSISIIPTDASCNQSNGSAVSNPSGGTAGYSFLWSNGENTSSVSNLTAGNYSVTVTDNNSCTSSATVLINSSAALIANISSVSVSCFGSADGSADITITNGTQPITYLWSNGENTASIANVAAGNYAATITDGTGCSTTASQTISEPDALDISITPTDASCNQNNGSAISNPSGGTAGYSYLWSNGENTSAISNLAAGSYSVTITDNNSCSSSTSVLINSSSALIANTSSVNASCFGSADGGADITITNGTQPITYLWSNGESTSAIANVAAGIYTVTATDGAGCLATASETVSEPDALNISITPSDAACNQNNGSAISNPSGGTAGYSYLWSNGENTSSVSNLGAGSYSVTVTDSNNCTAESSTTIANASSLVADAFVTDATCFGRLDGNASVNVTSGPQPYTYLWSNGGDSSSINNLGAGNYFVTITDGNNCQYSDTLVITQPDVIDVDVTASEVSCFGGADGSVLVSVTGGTPSYSYEWCNGSITPSAVNLAAGNCSVTITDANGCIIVSTILINEPSELQFTTSVTDATTGMNNGSADVTIIGGILPYSVQWSDGGDGANLSTGTYSFTITDNNGCIKTGSVVINEITGLNQLNEELSFRVYPNPATDEIFVVMNQWKDKTSVSVKSVLGQILLNQNISSETTAINLSILATGIYMLEVKQGELKSVKQIVISR